MSAVQVSKLRVVVCDDDSTRVQAWASRLRDLLDNNAFSVTPLSPGEFGEAIRALHERLKASKAGEDIPWDDAARHLDEADILVIDSDLTPDPGASIDAETEQVVDEYLVGEYGSNVARLARAYSTAGVLVVVNHIYKHRTFDLTMMRFADLPADVYITSTDLDNQGLWEGVANGGFRPWTWPNLPHLPPPDSDSLMGATLDSRVVESLGLDASQIELIEDKQWERLSFDVEPPESASLRDIAMSPSFGIGPIPDASAPDEQLLRVAKSAIRRWLDHVVLPSQNVLVDLPHLLQDRPWLAPKARKNGQELSRLVSSAWTGDQGIATEAYAADLSTLIGRAVWRVDRLPAREPHDRLDSEDLVFCEDTSDFRPPTDAHEFESNILGPFQSRFVAKLSDVEYTPIRRLLI